MCSIGGISPDVVDNNTFMRPRIFYPAPLTSSVEITLAGGAATHISKVLRLRKEDGVILFDGEGHDHYARIISVSRREVVVLVGESNDPRTESPLKVSLLQGICRNQRMDLLIQKCTELGIHVIRPILSERSVVKLGEERADKRQAHWRNVAISACEQCGRVRIPEIARPAPLSNAFDQIEDCATLMMLDPDGVDMPETEVRAATSIILLVGPEGGLTASEREAAVRAGFIRVRLGPRILRAETAPVAALSIMQYLAGDFNRP
jgi:16S rRNA (uracil1498-N3)-methyltransferase